jgi:hypothetical protein
MSGRISIRVCDGGLGGAVAEVDIDHADGFKRRQGFGGGSRGGRPFGNEWPFGPGTCRCGRRWIQRAVATASRGPAPPQVQAHDGSGAARSSENSAARYRWTRPFGRLLTFSKAGDEKYPEFMRPFRPSPLKQQFRRFAGQKMGGIRATPRKYRLLIRSIASGATVPKYFRAVRRLSNS